MSSQTPQASQDSYARQAKILRKNIQEWDSSIRRGLDEDWSKTLGRLNAAQNQTINMDKSIHDVMEHFVYQPRKATANPQDIPFFLSTRVEDEAAASGGSGDGKAASGETPVAAFSLDTTTTDPVEHLMRYEKLAAELATEYEAQMVRF